MEQSKVLSRITFITNVGDYLSLFATIFLVYHLTNDVLLSAYLLPIQSISIATAGLILPSVVSVWSLRSILFITQATCGLLMLIVAIFWSDLNPYLIISIYFLLSLLKSIFESSRDAFAKPPRESDKHRSTWVTIYAGKYGAQLISPVFVYFLIKYLPIEIPFVIDAISFFICAYLSTKLILNEIKKHSILKPFIYIWRFPALWRLTLIRSIGFFVPAGIFNYLIFSVVKNHFNLDIIDSIWIYFASAIGSMIAITILRDSDTKNIKIFFFIRNKISKIKNSYLCFIGFFGLALSRMFFFNISTYTVVLVILGISGFFMTLQAMGSQSLRSKITTAEQFPEIVGFEMTLAKISEWLIASICGLLLVYYPNALDLWLWIMVIAYAGLGVLMQSKHFEVDS